MKKHRLRQSTTQWAEIVKQLNATGMSFKEFCEQRDMAMATFSNWQRMTRLGSISAKAALRRYIPPKLSIRRWSITPAL